MSDSEGLRRMWLHVASLKRDYRLQPHDGANPELIFGPATRKTATFLRVSARFQAHRAPCALNLAPSLSHLPCFFHVEHGAIGKSEKTGHVAHHQETWRCRSLRSDSPDGRGWQGRRLFHPGADFLCFFQRPRLVNPCNTATNSFPSIGHPKGRLSEALRIVLATS